MYGEGRRPSLWLELTAHCNLNCAFCYNEWRPRVRGDYPVALSFDDQCVNIARLIERIDFEFVALSGGEPLLNPFLLDLVDWLSIRRQWTILTTNGRAFNRNRAELLKESGLNGVQVPLLAADPDLHDALSGRACWVQVVTALALALELGFTTSVTFVLTRSNAAELPHVIKLLSQIGVRRIIVVTLQLGGSAVPNAKDLYIADDVAIPLVELARSTAEKEGVQLVAVPDRSLTAAPGRPWLRWALSPNGELKLCNLSTKTLGHLSTISEADLDELASDLAVGRLDKFRDRVDTCTCFNRITQGSVHRVTPKVNAEATFDEI
jgi:MoaA/NifB/PqqE/SkfB family radical SAM enzyme